MVDTATDRDRNLPATPEPTVDSTRFVQLRTQLDPYGAYDPRFASYELELLPLNTDRDTAMEAALVAADGDERVWLVVTGEVKWVATTEGRGKVKSESALDVTAGSPAK